MSTIRWKDLQVDWHNVKYQIDCAPHGTTGHVKNHIARQLGISIHQLHSAIRFHFGKQKEVERTTEIDRELIYAIAEMKVAGKRAGSGEREIPTWRCIDILKDWKAPGADQLTVSTVNRVLRNEFALNQPIPRTRWEPEYALQEVQVDYSTSKYFRPAKEYDDEGNPILIATNRILSYKEKDVRRRLMLGVVMDTYSRIRFHSGYICAGESALNSIEFLNHFFTRPDDELVFKHLAWNFRIDNGPLFSSTMGQSFFKTIDRPVENTIPYGKSGLGKAERGWQLVWSWEQDLVTRIGVGARISLADYNQLLLQECIRQQQQKHPFKVSEYKIDLYQKSVLAQTPRPEIIDVDLTKLVFTSLKRKVGADQLIRIDNEYYQVPVMAGDHYTTDRWIRVIINKDGRMMGELIDRYSEPFEIFPETRSLRGRFNTAPQTTAQRINVDLDGGHSIIDQIRKPFAVNPSAAANPTYLMPQNKPAAVQSPFNNNTDKPEEPEQFNSKFAAMQFVGQQLKLEGIELQDDLFDYFEEFVINAAFNRTDIEQQVKAFIYALNHQPKNTGTHE